MRRPADLRERRRGRKSLERHRQRIDGSARRSRCAGLYRPGAVRCACGGSAAGADSRARRQWRASARFFTPVMEQLLSGLGGKSDWITGSASRVLPASVTVVDDPGAKEFQGTATDRRLCRRRRRRPRAKDYPGGKRHAEKCCDVAPARARFRSSPTATGAPHF